MFATQVVIDGKHVYVYRLEILKEFKGPDENRYEVSCLDYKYDNGDEYLVRNTLLSDVITDSPAHSLQRAINCLATGDIDYEIVTLSEAIR